MLCRKFFFFVVCALFGAFPLAAQFLANPNDRFYHDLELWEGRGLVSQLPVARPYPAQLVRELLERVVSRGGREDSRRAREYLEELSRDFSWHLEGGGEATKEGGRTYGAGYGEFQGGGWLSGAIHVEGRFRGLIMDNTEGFVLPAGKRTSVDIFDTWADISAGGRKLNLRQSQNVSFTAGEADLYFQAGIMRNSFGPFWGDSVVLSPEASHTGHYSFMWRGKRLAYSTVLLELAATSYLKPASEIEAMAVQKFPNKHLVIQSLNVYPTDWLELGYFETMVWGGRMDMTYLLPFKELFYAQSMAGFEDNSLVGLLADIRVMKTLKIPLIMYMDDTNLNDLLSFKFGTKFKVAAQAGITWTPLEAGPLKRIRFDYVAVTPFMYTHRSGLQGVPQPSGPGDTAGRAAREAALSLPNYNNYTHAGENIGVGLEPNSDRLSLSFLFEPVEGLRFTFTGRAMRHANASAKMMRPDDPNSNGGVGGRNDGSIYDDGYDVDGNPIFHYETRFLSQDVVEKIFQGGVQAEVFFRLGPGSVTLSGGYLFERILNKSLVPGLTETNHYFNAGLGYRY
ncbi:MAG: hypothetical protein LBC67_05605 [Spirochaetales bacterium]|nr:hypothetical protein [Spirochaetales bacterium]